MNIFGFADAYPLLVQILSLPKNRVTAPWLHHIISHATPHNNEYQSSHETNKQTNNKKQANNNRSREEENTEIDTHAACVRIYLLQFSSIEKGVVLLPRHQPCVPGG